MAAYAALCSLMHIVEQLQNHPHPPISLDIEQVESLTEIVTSLQQFLEGCSNGAGYSEEADPLECRIADAAHAAEDVIESHIVDRIHAGSTRHGVNTSSVGFYQGLRKVIEEMDSIKKEVMEINDKTGVRDQHHKNSKRTADSSRPSSTRQNTMVGFDEALLEILDKLTGGDPGRQVIPIVGMGGMGKTTLARNVYVSPLIQQYFGICAWTTISTEYNTREILREILSPGNKVDSSDIEELGVKLHQYLSGRRYLIVLDDMWSIEVWNEIRRFFPDNNKGSRIVITTRLSNLTSQLTNSYCMDMKFLDEDKSWNLLCKTVFGEEGCPPELEQIGKKISKNCRGLPLSIVVIGGLLVKSEHSRKNWAYIAENLNSLVNREDDKHCLKILYMSYKQMPVYLKPCFLYMGIFSEDSVIEVTMLIRLWVAEGFLKPISGRCLEEIAEEYLKELIDRNLVRALWRVGEPKCCSIHDLLRDLCLREAQKERFYNVKREDCLNDSKGINTERRIVVVPPRGEFRKEVSNDLQSESLLRSLRWEYGDMPLPRNCRLLRVLHTHAEFRYYIISNSSLEQIFRFVNSRYLAIYITRPYKFPSSVRLLWNLQSLIIYPGDDLTAPPEIWMMPQLRHINFTVGLYLPDPPIHRNNSDIVLTNLQSLSLIRNFKFCEEVIRRIPNLKELRVDYVKVEGSPHYFLHNLDRLLKLESFDCTSYLSQKPEDSEFLLKLSFPRLLKKLSLADNYFHWEEMMEKIGSLPLLEVLNLTGGSLRGSVWETVEDQFSSLKFLMVSRVRGLENWNSESTHFPCLEQLFLENLVELKEIPSGIGDISTLQSIDLIRCSYSAAFSASKILEDLEEFGDVTLKVRAYHYNEEEDAALEHLASRNFQVGRNYLDYKR